MTNKHQIDIISRKMFKIQLYRKRISMDLRANLIKFSSATQRIEIRFFVIFSYNLNVVLQCLFY